MDIGEHEWQVTRAPVARDRARSGILQITLATTGIRRNSATKTQIPDIAPAKTVTALTRGLEALSRRRRRAHTTNGA